jgi:hypothetical protein
MVIWLNPTLLDPQGNSPSASTTSALSNESAEVVLVFGVARCYQFPRSNVAR